MDNLQVYLGVWTNWSRGAVMGATLTTTREYGNLLIAFTAFFIPFVATRFWRICCFFLHRLHSTTAPKEAIHHQRQVLLRNASSMESALVTLFSLIKSWHARKHGKVRMLLPLFAFTMIIISAFTVAGGFSSRISSAASDEVLINGNNCNAIGFSSNDLTLEMYEALIQYESKTYTDAANYAQRCYSDDSSRLLGCDRFVVQGLKTAVTETNRSCPFQGDICRSNNANIRLDTGYIDSHDHLGLNTPPSKRIGYRYVLECAPLKTEGYVTYVNQGNVTWARYHYGDANLGGPDNRTTLNFTYEVEDLSSQYRKDYQGQITGDFFISTISDLVMNGEVVSIRSNFAPIPELLRTDGDLTIVFLSGNGVYFKEPMDDDWYRATAEGRDDLTHLQNDGTQVGYRPVDAASPLACVEQWQWCTSNYQDEDGCGPLASGMDALYGASHLFNVSGDVWLSERAYSNTSLGSHFVWPAIIGSTGDECVEWAIKQLKSADLASRASSGSGYQYPLPKNQWHLDVQMWWNTVLAKTQANMIGAAIGHTDPLLKNYSSLPWNQYEQNLCYNQKIRSTNYTSFSLFGLYFTYITGALIVLISFILEPIFGCLHSRNKYKQYEHLEWTTNETLQLHRLAHEGAGSQPWTGCTDSVPTTLPDANLAILDIEDLTHPVLAQPFKVEQDVIQVAEVTDDHPDTINSEANVQVDTGGGITVIHVGETSEEPTEDDLNNHIGHDSPISTIGHDSRDSLQPSLSPAHSISSDHVPSAEAQVNSSQPRVSPNSL